MPADNTDTRASLKITADQLLAQLPKVLEELPASWRGTTFKNKVLLGRGVFSDRLSSLLLEKTAEGSAPVTTDDLLAVGNAEDYLRVSSNVSSTLELLLARQQGLPIEQVFTFASTAMPIVAVLLTTNLPVRLYHGDAAAPFGEDATEIAKLLGASLEQRSGAPPATQEAGVVTLALQSAVSGGVSSLSGVVDGVIGKNVLYIANTETIVPDKVLVIRKRMATPITTPAAEAVLQKEAGLEDTTGIATPSDDDLAAFLGHLQTLSGTESNADSRPVVFTAGLPAICSFMVSLIQRGGVDVLQCSTAYGGSSQLTDILSERAATFTKHTYDIQGDANIEESIRGQLNHLASKKDTLHPATVLFVEIPTNPDMKVPDPSAITTMLRAYQNDSGKRAILLVDTTFAPNSQVLSKVRELEPDLTAFAFISLSKSVSAGYTTAGTIVANHTAEASEIQRAVARTAAALDTTARPDQLQKLVANHVGVEDRCDQAYQTALTTAAVLLAAVKTHTGEDMFLRFPTEAQAKAGFTSSTYSFNLPVYPGGDQAVNEALAQRFVDLLCEHKEFKPCVSFGQNNGLVYATVPATSTQGAIKEEHKAKQAVGGVQLVRLSFPPVVTDSVNAHIAASIAKLYAK